MFENLSDRLSSSLRGITGKATLTEDNIQGSPDLIVEVISKGTEVKDRREKKNLYEKFGVREYILVFPEREYEERYCLKKGKFRFPCPEFSCHVSDALECPFRFGRYD